MSENLTKHFTMRKWKQLDQWSCNECGYDTLEGEQVMLTHLERTHYPPPKPPKLAKSQILRVSRFGKEILDPDFEQVVETEEELMENGIDVSTLKVDEVLSLVESGELDKGQVIESEREGKARKSLLDALGQEA